jgi:hypothetical protein
MIQPPSLDSNLAPTFATGGNASSMGQGIGIPTSVSDGLGGWGNAAGTVLSDYNNASTDTGSSVLSGAVSGAIAGSQIMPGWGTVIGGVVGGLAGLFGSKSKKKQANQQFQQNLQLATAGEQQRQANYLQNQKLTAAAISPYASSYKPNGYQYKNNVFGGANQNTNVPQPQAGTLNIPNAPPTLTSPGLGKPLNTNMPAPSFTPNTFAGPAANPQVPQYSNNPATNQQNVSNYAQQIALQDYQKNQQAAAAAMNPYAAYFPQGQG